MAIVKRLDEPVEICHESIPASVGNTGGAKLRDPSPLRARTCCLKPAYFTALIMSKMERYMATIMPPTITPSTTIMIGSTSEARLLSMCSPTQRERPLASHSSFRRRLSTRSPGPSSTGAVREGGPRWTSHP